MMFITCGDWDLKTMPACPELRPQMSSSTAPPSVDQHKERVQ
jgi:hypothetical protein